MENENLYEYEILKNGGKFIAVEILCKIPYKMKKLPAQNVDNLLMLSQKTTVEERPCEIIDNSRIYCREK